MEDTLEITEDMRWFAESWFASAIDKMGEVSHIPMLREQVVDEAMPMFRGAIEALYDQPGKRAMIEIAIETLQDLRLGL